MDLDGDDGHRIRGSISYPLDLLQSPLPLSLDLGLQIFEATREMILMEFQVWGRIFALLSSLHAFFSFGAYGHSLW